MAPKRNTHANNKDYCKRYREKNKEKYKKNDAQRKRYKRILAKLEKPGLYEEQKKKNRDRMRLSRELKKQLQQESQNQTPASSQGSSSASSSAPSSAFSTKQSRYRSLRRAEENLPGSPRKKMEVIGSLAKKYKMRIALKPKRGRKYEDLSEEQIEWLKEFLDRADMTYINPGKKDHVYIGKVDGVSRYVQKQYLLWTLQETLDIVNGNEIVGFPRGEESFMDQFDKALSFAKLYSFFKCHKQYIWNKNIPQSSCLCEVCENACLFAKGVNKCLKLKLPTNPHDLVELYACDSDQTVCMNGACDKCKIPLKWNTDEEDPESSESTNIDSSSSESSDEKQRNVTFYRWGKTERTTKLCITLDEEEAWESWCELVKNLKCHIHRKRKQVEYYNHLKKSLKKDECIVHVDYSEGYSNKQQDEIQSAYFGHATFSIFTACGYFRPSDTVDLVKVPITIVSEANDHSRINAHMCVSKVIDCVEERMPVANRLKRVFVWSDGCASQFRSRYVFSLFNYLHPDKQLEWNYNEAHHGKGPMDGIGGTLKNKVFREVKSGRIVVDSPYEFFLQANRIVESITTLYLPTNEIVAEPSDIKDAPAIKGTLDVHKVIRKKNEQGVNYLEFFHLSLDSDPCHTQYYRTLHDPIVCGHESHHGGSNSCAHCLNTFIEGQEWMECPVCKQWYCGEDCFSA